MNSIKGIIHVHSNFSYDGRHSLDELAEYARKREYRFVAMSEHSDTMDAARVVHYVEECRRVSTPECLIIPGIEFTCENNLHLIGVGIEDFIDSRDPLKVSQFIQEKGGGAVVAHPVRYDYRVPLELADHLIGIEVWNAGYDGRFLPNDRSLRLLRDFKELNESLRAFGGQDLHRINHHAHVQVSMTDISVEKHDIMRAFKEGRFTISNGYFQLEASRDPGFFKMLHLSVARRIYDFAKMVRERIGVQG